MAARAKKKPKGDSIEVRRGIYCVRHGHSNVVSGCFGYVYCGRCGDQIGDALAGVYRNDNAVIIGHDCKICRANAKKLTRRDTTLLAKEAADHVAKLLKKRGAKAEARSS